VRPDGGGSLVGGERQVERCEVSVLAEAIRRGERLARVPFRVDGAGVRFSTVGDYAGTIDVHRDSVVVVVRHGRTSVKQLQGGSQTADSLTVSLARRYGASWSPGVASNALLLAWRGEEGEVRHLPPRVRFTIPRVAGDSLRDQWVVFTHHLSVAKTASNPLGLAWTYMHVPEGVFRGVEPATR
jgi:hypothetical protein